MAKKSNTAQKPETRLHALDSIIRLSGESYESLAKGLGITKNTVMVWKRKDDIKISRLAEAASFCGYNLSIGICKGATRIEELIFPVNQTKPISFFSKMLPYYGMTLNDVLKKTKLPKGTITGWMYQEKCTLADVLFLAEKMGMTLWMDFVPASKETQEKRQNGGMVSKIEISEYYYKGIDIGE